MKRVIEHTLCGALPQATLRQHVRSCHHSITARFIVTERGLSTKHIPLQMASAKELLALSIKSTGLSAQAVRRQHRQEEAMKRRFESRSRVAPAFQNECTHDARELHPLVESVLSLSLHSCDVVLS